MTNTTTFKGRAAELRWGYACAGTLGSWTMTADPTGLRVTAEVLAIDAYRAAQQPLTFCVIRQTTVWQWPVVSLHIAGSTLTATLSPQEDRDGGLVHQAGDRTTAPV